LAAKIFFTSIKASQELKKEYYPKLLSTIGLNRHYDIESIRLIAQDIWKTTIKENGKEWVTDHLKNFLEYYLEQAKSKDDQIREASYGFIEELFEHTEIISKEKLEELTKDTLKVVIRGMEDSAWEVRTEANSTATQLLLVVSLSEY
jgi:predicted nucleotide-binding protein (sugar kinase/HSP70/actin superfamily)